MDKELINTSARIPETETVRINARAEKSKMDFDILKKGSYILFKNNVARPNTIKTAASLGSPAML